MMTRAIALSTFVVALLLAWQSAVVWSMTRSCATTARSIIAAADPLDRTPPPQLASAIAKNIALDRMYDYLATIMLDRYKCGGGAHWSRTEWLIDRPALAWHLRTTFAQSQIVALFASTADTGKGTIGINRGAQRIHGRDVTALSDNDLDCLVWRSLGKPLHQSLGSLAAPLCVEEFKLLSPTVSAIKS